MTDREQRSDGFRNRFSSGPSIESDNQNKSDNTSNTSKENEAEKGSSNDGNEHIDNTRDSSELDSGTTDDLIKDRKSVLMYLSEDVRRELDIRFDELNAKHKRQHGEALEKNRDYYPAVIQAGLTDKDLEEVLEL